jgi:small subunit ribosomal protein S20
VANLPSVEKRHRQSLKRQARNVAKRTHVKTVVKKLRDLIGKKDANLAQAALREASRVIDAAASKGVLTKANASRRIARLSKAVHQLGK